MIRKTYIIGNAGISNISVICIHMTCPVNLVMLIYGDIMPRAYICYVISRAYIYYIYIYAIYIGYGFMFCFIGGPSRAWRNKMTKESDYVHIVDIVDTMPRSTPCVLVGSRSIVYVDYLQYTVRTKHTNTVCITHIHTVCITHMRVVY